MKEDINSFYSSYFQDIYRFHLTLCKKYQTAEDLVQETVLLFRGRQAIRQRRTEKSDR
jgi:DNA-directed RNA polymerase specialized sigma24 family protein